MNRPVRKDEAVTVVAQYDKANTTSRLLIGVLVFNLVVWIICFAALMVLGVTR